MNKILVILSLVLLASCGPSAEEKKNIALNTCSIMGETKKSDSLFRMQTIIDAREKIGGEPFVRGDDAILEAFEWGLCQELVLNESYDETLQPLKDAKRERERIAAEKLAEEKRIAAEKRLEEQRIAREKRAEENRIAAEKLAEENRIAVEKQRIADSKPTIKEEFYSRGKLKSRINYQPKSDGGKKDGLYETYHENGQLKSKGNFKDGKQDGLWEGFYDNGQLGGKGNYKDGELINRQVFSLQDKLLEDFTYTNSQKTGVEYKYYNNDDADLWQKLNYKDGKQHGLHEEWNSRGYMKYKMNYKDGKKHGIGEDYSAFGSVSIRTNYKHGKKDGLMEELYGPISLRKNVCFKNGGEVDMSYCEK